MNKRWSLYTSIITSALVLIGGSYFIAHATDSGAAWTTESARKIDVQRNPRKLPNIALIDTNGQRVSPSNFKKRFQLVNFIYTQCPTTCIGLGLEFRQLQSDLITHGLDSQVQLISISFDLENDSPREVSNYLDRFNAKKSQWDGYVFTSKTEMALMLDTLQVTVIPDEKVGFIHNAAIYMVEDGHVIEIFDFQSRRTLLDRLNQYLG